MQTKKLQEHLDAMFSKKLQKGAVAIFGAKNGLNNKAASKLYQTEEQVGR